jgi:hypothetical protein
MASTKVVASMLLPFSVPDPHSSLCSVQSWHGSMATKATASKHNLDPCLCFHLSVSHNCQWNFCQLLKNSGFVHLWSDEAWLVMWCLSCLTHWKVFDCLFSVSKHHAGVFLLLCKIWLKYDRNSGHRIFSIVVCPKCWTDYLILLYTHQWFLMMFFLARADIRVTFGLLL